MSEALSSRALLRLLHLSSPALPVGSFAFSQGLEWAIERGGVDTPDALADWWQGLIEYGLGQTDLPLLLRLHQAWGDADAAALVHWNQLSLACRETAELRAEDRQVGQALLRLLENLDVTEAVPWRHEDAGVLLAWSLAAVHWSIPARQTALAYAWAWLENQVVAAGKILPLAQTPAQSLLLQFDEVLIRATDQAEGVRDHDVGQSLPGWAQASALHEIQYSRLFRS